MLETWRIKPEAPENFFEKFSELPRLQAQLLYNRGLTEAQEVSAFLNPAYENLYSPYLFKDMDKAVSRIFRALENQEKICIYGDYDADAITANAVLQQAFKFLGVEVESYIPDRFSEGYGVNLEALSRIKDKGLNVLITVDCGTNSTDAADWCKKNSVDLIITDHHEIIGQAPDAFALINPKNPNDAYPDQNITGVGVAFKLAFALLNHSNSRKIKPDLALGSEKWLLDLVAIGTVADCHALTGENRILLKYGLKVLVKTKWVGLRAIMAAAGLLTAGSGGQMPEFSKALQFKFVPDTYTLGFVIAPRLNAAGRLEHANIALKLLMQDNISEALKQALELENINKRRQDITARVLSEAREQVQIIGSRKILALSGTDWPKGVVGLVAGKLAEEFYRPTIVLSKDLELATGSARTVGDFSIIEALKFSSQHLIRFGGHKQAAGLTLKNEFFESFYESLLEYAELNPFAEEKVLNLDAELKASDLQLQTYALISALEPFGVGNLKPKFLIASCAVKLLKVVGNKAQHIQLQFLVGDKLISGIGFGLANLAKRFKIGDVVNIACELMEDSFNGNKQLKLRVIDLKPYGNN